LTVYPYQTKNYLDCLCACFWTLCFMFSTHKHHAKHKMEAYSTLKMARGFEGGLSRLNDLLVFNCFYLMFFIFFRTCILSLKRLTSRFCPISSQHIQQQNMRPAWNRHRLPMVRHFSPLPISHYHHPSSSPFAHGPVGYRPVGPVSTCNSLYLLQRLIKISSTL